MIVSNRVWAMDLCGDCYRCQDLGEFERNNNMSASLANVQKVMYIGQIAIRWSVGHSHSIRMAHLALCAKRIVAIDQG